MTRGRYISRLLPVIFHTSGRLAVSKDAFLLFSYGSAYKRRGICRGPAELWQCQSYFSRRQRISGQCALQYVTLAICFSYVSDVDSLLGHFYDRSCLRKVQICGEDAPVALISPLLLRHQDQCLSCIRQGIPDYAKIQADLNRKSQPTCGRPYCRPSLSYDH
jgi:hypothetical protein